MRTSIVYSSRHNSNHFKYRITLNYVKNKTILRISSVLSVSKKNAFLLESGKPHSEAMRCQELCISVKTQNAPINLKYDL